MKNEWSEGDIARFGILKVLFQHTPKLLEWLFVPIGGTADDCNDFKPEMFAGPEIIKSRAGAFSSGEQILVSIACEIWFNDAGDVFNICRRLDANNFRAVTEAMTLFRGL